MSRTELARRWLAYVDARSRSGLSQRAYCADRDLSVKSFPYWRRKRCRVAAASDSPRLVPVRLIEEPVSTGVAGSGARLHSGGVVIDLALQFDAVTLQRVLSVLEGRC